MQLLCNYSHSQCVCQYPCGVSVEILCVGAALPCNCSTYKLMFLIRPRLGTAKAPAESAEALSIGQSKRMPVRLCAELFASLVNRHFKSKAHINDNQYTLHQCKRKNPAIRVCESCGSIAEGFCNGINPAASHPILRLIVALARRPPSTHGYTLLSHTGLTDSFSARHMH